jgi:hypothetical protein
MCCGVCAGRRGAAVWCGGSVSGLWWSCHGALVVVASVVAIARPQRRRQEVRRERLRVIAEGRLRLPLHPDT